MVTEICIQWYTVNPVLRITSSAHSNSLNPPAGSRVGPVKSVPNKVAAELFIPQGGAEPLSSVPVWAEPGQLLIGIWPSGQDRDDFVRPGAPTDLGELRGIVHLCSIQTRYVP
jgi:hypothetical protein